VLSTVEKVILLQNVGAFRNLTTEQISYLAAIAEEVSVAANEVIYELGDASDSLYIVLKGRVRLHRGDEDLSGASANEPFGTWALFDSTPRVTSATALEDTCLLCVDREDFLELLSDHVRITEAVMGAIVGRLRGLLDRVGSEITTKART